MTSVTVVIPTYNRADLLEATLRSVLAQTLAPDEIVVVDDGSTDHTKAVCARYAAPVRYVYQENRGLPAARNTGIRESTAEWVAFIDSDDLWHPRKLEWQLAAVEATGAKWSATGFDLIDPSGSPLQDATDGFTRAFALFQESRVAPSDHFGRWLRRVELTEPADAAFVGDAFGMLFLGNTLLPSTVLVARPVMDRAGVFDESFRWAEDTEYFHRLAAVAPILILMSSLTSYRVGHASMISARNASPFIHYAMKSLEQAAHLRPLSALERSAFREGRRRLRLRLAYNRLSALDTAGARRALLEGVRDGSSLSIRGVSILAASVLPGAVLHGLHVAKRSLRAFA